MFSRTNKRASIYWWNNSIKLSPSNFPKSYDLPYSHTTPSLQIVEENLEE